MSTEMAWVRGLQDKEGVLQGCWLDFEAVFTTCPWEMWLNCSWTGFKEAGEEYALVCAWTKVRGCLRVKPFHVATTPCLPSLLLFQTHAFTNTHTNAQTLFLVSVLVSPDATASGISSMSHVTGWRCDSCPYARLSLTKVTTHTNTLINNRCTGALLQG